MAEINLLQGTQPVTRATDRWLKVFNAIGVTLFVLAVLAAGAVFYFSRNSDAQKISLAAQLAQSDASIRSLPQYPVLLADQTRVSNLKVLLDKHLDWSTLLPKFFDATLTNATYSKFVADSDGSATITGNVQNFSDLDKLIQAYQLADFKSYINDIKLVNIGLSTDQTKPGVTFTINVTFNKDIIKYELVSDGSPAPTK